MKTDKEIRQKLKKENSLFQKLEGVWDAIDERHTELPIKNKIYGVMLLFIDQYRKEHPEI